MLDMEAPVDGIFRAVPNMVGSMQPSGVAPGKNGKWVVTLNLAGELYQANFDSQVRNKGRLCPLAAMYRQVVCSEWQKVMGDQALVLPVVMTAD
jgi:hypothetical protein